MDGSAKNRGVRWKSLMAFMRTKMDLKDYKRFKCESSCNLYKINVQAHSVDISAIDWRAGAQKPPKPVQKPY